MSLTVKVHLERNGNPKAEIRRLGVPPDVHDYQFLCQKLSEVFPCLTKKNFSLCWSDPEGDFITFSSDDELREAVTFVLDGVLRIYLKEDIAAREGPLHPNVFCNGCDEAVYGVRYKCCSCQNLDLCGVCEAKGLHPDHDMWKIVTPKERNKPGDFIPPYFRRWMRRFTKHWHERNSGECSAHSAETQCPRKAARAEGEKATEDQGETTEEEMLLKVGEEFAAMFDPLCETVNFAGPQGCPRRQGHCQKEWSQRPGNPHGKVEKCQSKSVMGTEQFESAIGTKSSESAASGAVAPADKANQNNRVKKPEESQKAPGTMSEQAPATSVSSGEWTVLTGLAPNNIQTDGNGPTCIYPQIPHNMNRGIPMMPPLNCLPPPPRDPKIAQALHQMMAMGFHNEGGWLTRLLEAKNGDISQVLDVIRPEQHPAAPCNDYRV